MLNAAFIRDYTVHLEAIKIDPAPKGEKKGSENWLEGFGIWAAEDLQTIEVEILPPAAEYYAAQRWHPDQEDHWDNEVLIRKFPGMISPELVRRVLSLGRFVRGIKPTALADAVFQDAWVLVQALQVIRPGGKVS